MDKKSKGIDCKNMPIVPILMKRQVVGCRMTQGGEMRQFTKNKLKWAFQFAASSASGLMFLAGCGSSGVSSPVAIQQPRIMHRASNQVPSVNGVMGKASAVSRKAGLQPRPESQMESQFPLHPATENRTSVNDSLPLLGDQKPLGYAQDHMLIAWEDGAESGDTHEPTPETPLPVPNTLVENRHPIDFRTALQLAGANNLQIALANERIHEALARVDEAQALWLPSLNLGVGYNRHDGQIQETQGGVLDVGRQSLFVGGGPATGAAPLSGASGGPARLFVGLNPAEAYFKPLAAKQLTHAAQADHSATFNDTLLQVGLIYYELVNAQMQVAIFEESVSHYQRLYKLADDFVDAGTGLPADASRVSAQLQEARANQLRAEKDVQVVSAELARLLRLDASVTLYPAETVPYPVMMISTDIPLSELIAQGLCARPELARHQALVAEATSQWKLEKWRPLVPNLFLGTSAGGFGGGPNGFFGDFEGRNDFDALAVWEVKNLGLGNRALKQQRASQQRQQVLAFQQISDRVATDIAKAYHQADLSAKQVEETRAQVQAAAEALPLNFRGIRGGELRVIEAQQAIKQLVDARQLYLKAVIENNQAQLQLLRAIGNPPDAPASYQTPVSPPTEPLVEPVPTTTWPPLPN